jgi:NAD(P)-dependent dehydrogenase (short-subunit alcohol dehydrogenase family)
MNSDRFPHSVEVVTTALKGASVFVTGGSLGMREALAQDLYVRGAAKVYAPPPARTVTHPDAVPVTLEVTDPASVAAATAQADDVTALINNAAVVGAGVLDSPGDDVLPRVRDQLLRPPAARPRLSADHRAQQRRPHPQRAALRALLAGPRRLLQRLQGTLWSQTNSLHLGLGPRDISVTGLRRPRCSCRILSATSATSARSGQPLPS